MTPVIIDGNSLWARSYFAAKHELSAPQMLTGIKISVVSIISLLSPISHKLSKTPSHLLFCWDGAAKRDKGRAEKPPEYHEGLDRCVELLGACFGGAHAFPAEEADDAVATAAARMEALPEVETVYVASGDKDLQQLASEKIVYYSLNLKATMGWAAICSKWGVKHPSQVSIALACLGDAGDNINGVDKWGPKKVAKVFAQVTEDMPLDRVAELVASSMSEKEFAQFSDSLNLTLLRKDIANVPDPGPIVIGGQDKLEQYGWRDLWTQLTILQTSYDTRITEEMLE